jgi:hypothetical protein
MRGFSLIGGQLNLLAPDWLMESSDLYVMKYMTCRAIYIARYRRGPLDWRLFRVAKNKIRKILKKGFLTAAPQLILQLALWLKGI